MTKREEKDVIGMMKQTSKEAAEFSNFFMNAGQTANSKNEAFGKVNKSSPYSSAKSSIRPVKLVEN